MLEAAYPNPFSTATTLRYAIPTNGPVQLVVLDALGREVARLADGRQQAGWHVARVDARSLPSGVYIVRLVTEQSAETRRVVLLK